MFFTKHKHIGITTGRAYFEPVARVQITKISLIVTRSFHLERMISFLLATFPSFKALQFHLPTRLMGFLSSLRARRSRPAAFHVQQDIRQESQIVLLWMRGAHATGSPQQRQACVPPLAPCQKVNHQHMLEITFMFTAEDIFCQTNAKLNVINLRIVNVPGHLPAELP